MDKTEKKNTKLKVEKPKSDTLRQGIYPSKVKDAVVEAKKATVEFEVQQQGETKIVSKQYPAVLRPGPLLEAIRAIKNEKVTIEDLGDEFEMSDLVGKDALIVIEHKSGAGGNLKPVVGLVLPISYTLPKLETKTV